MIWLELLGSALVVANIGCMAYGRRKLGFTMGLASAIVWAAVAWLSGLMVLLALQVFIARYCIRGLKREIGGKND